ncbi:MAG: tRNA preQ1(34) S-adenosylmethionine ribosyltransferase-isomerase QueA [Bryobacteraceae bacterium]|nr:tRNA preQ1(34) S-adenosylmethionine ribosyltransferase-isomerase QueA [Bryobacteraceae bacterium]
MKVSEFTYALPPDSIAQEPLAERDGSRMLVLDRAKGEWLDRRFRDLPEHLAPGDCLVVNDTRVRPSRLYGRRAGGTGTVELLLLRELDPVRRRWQALVRPGRRLHEGAVIELSETLGAIVEDTGVRGERTIRFLGDPAPFIAEHGHMPLPPYIRRDDSAVDRERYQTVYGDKVGSAAAPTAGLHFTPEILDRCRAAGADIARVTLHVGLGTFAPLHAETLDQVKLHAETYAIDPGEWERIESAKRRVAVGTTSVRTLESAARTGELSGDTNLFLSPGAKFEKVDAMLTNFHLPESSLLMLVCAFAGTELTLAAYRYAVAAKYRFFSYGDCMLIV